jgi:hypothetical protein
MAISQGRILRKHFRCGLEGAMKAYSEELFGEMSGNNILREKTIAAVLIILNVILLMVDTLVFSKSWNYLSGYVYLFYAHIAGIAGLTVILLLIRLRKSRGPQWNGRMDGILHISSIVFILVWCTFLSINAQLIHDQISAYIIGVIFIASSLILTPLQGLILFLSAYAMFVSGLFIIEHDAQNLSGNIINSSFVFILALVISNIKYSSYLKDFKNRKIISQKNAELDNLNRNLERMVEERTGELLKANQLLIDEINARHEAEMRALRSKLLYEEKTRALNEAMEYEKLRVVFFANLSHEFRTP